MKDTRNKMAFVCCCRYVECTNQTENRGQLSVAIIIACVLMSTFIAIDYIIMRQYKGIIIMVGL